LAESNDDLQSRGAGCGASANEAEEQLRAIHRQHEPLVKARKQLEAQGRSLMVNHGIEPIQQW
jgi:hypothetical protein